MNKRDARFYRESGDKILLEGMDANVVNSVYNCTDQTAKAFLYLMTISGMKILPLDEEAVSHASDKVECVASMQQVKAFRFRLEEDWQDKMSESFLYFEDENDPVIIRKRGASRFERVTTENLKAVHLTKNQMNQMRGEAVTLSSVIPSNGAGMVRTFWKSAKGIKLNGLLFLLFSLITAGTSAALPIGTNYILSTLIPTEDNTSILLVGIGIFMVVLGGFLANVISNLLCTRIQINWQTDFFMKLCEHLLRLPSGTIRKKVYQLPGEMMQVMFAVGSFVSGLLSLVLIMIQMIVALIQMNSFSQGVEGIVFFPIVLYSVICLILILQAYRKSKETLINETELNAFRIEMLNGMENIRGDYSEPLFYYRNAVHYDRKARVSYSGKTYAMKISAMNTLISSLVTYTLYYQIITLGQCNIPMLLSFTSAMSLALSHQTRLLSTIQSMISTVPQLRKAQEILREPTENGEHSEQAGTITGNITLSHVTFRYEGMNHDVISDLSLHIRAGEHVGICGESGCGKSTLLRLMLGFEKPSSGGISYDDYDIMEYDPKYIRKQFGVVLQDAQLMAGSIKKNISLSNHPDMEKLREAAANAAVLEDIEQMPMKFETIVSSESAMVSGGQKQRIVIARALMNKPKVLFFDEATSALDNETQASVQESIDRMKSTCIIIAHRLSTIQNCDRIILLEKGSVAEQGTFRELMELDGKFAQMARRNML